MPSRWQEARTLKIAALFGQIGVHLDLTVGQKHFQSWPDAQCVVARLGQLATGQDFCADGLQPVQ